MTGNARGINFTVADLARLDKIAAGRGMTRSAVVREAIAVLSTTGGVKVREPNVVYVKAPMTVFLEVGQAMRLSKLCAILGMKRTEVIRYALGMLLEREGL